MYRERINEERKKLGLSAKAMAERSTLKVTEETIGRFLSGKINAPHLSTLMDMGAAVGLAPYELFMDSLTAADFKLFLETKLRNIDNAAELEVLRIKTAEQEQQIALLEERLSHKDELLSVYKLFCKDKV